MTSIRPPPPSIRLKRLNDGSVLIAAGKQEVLAVPSRRATSHDFFEPNHERYQQGDRVALGRGWRPLEIATRSQFELSRAFLEAEGQVPRQSRDGKPR